MFIMTDPANSFASHESGKICLNFRQKSTVDSMGSIAYFCLYIVCLIPSIALHCTKATNYANVCFLLKNQQKMLKCTKQ